MSDSRLPRTTMVNFIKKHVSDKSKISAEFTSVMLDFSNCFCLVIIEFIDRVAGQANAVCESQGKKTINNEHLYSALKVPFSFNQKLGMSQMLIGLQETDQAMKIKQKKKNEDKQRLQETIEKLYKQKEGQNKKEDQKSLIFEKKSNLVPLNMDEMSEENFKEILDQEESKEK